MNPRQYPLNSDPTVYDALRRFFDYKKVYITVSIRVAVCMGAKQDNPVRLIFYHQLLHNGLGYLSMSCDALNILHISYPCASKRDASFTDWMMRP